MKENKALELFQAMADVGDDLIDERSESVV